MEPVFQKDYVINDMFVDRYGRMKPAAVLFLAQEVAGMHCYELELDYDTLARRNLFWAVTRHRVQIKRMPTRQEKLTVETWPMPTTRVAYPRSMVVYDQEGNECFRSISIWVLMDKDTRHMILPGKSGISLRGTIRGGELPSPNGLIAKPLSSTRQRTVSFTDLDRNGHMNNTRYMDWIDDLMPSAFHAQHSLKEFTVCYLSEAKEGQDLQMRWDMVAPDCLQVEAWRKEDDQNHRIFSAQMHYE